jgi:ABC-type transporter Mla subunit MlaD
VRTQTSYLLIGSFVISGVVLLTASLVALGAGPPTRDVIKAETLFDDSVSGLEVGAPVRFRGVTVGRVTHITVAGALYQETESTYVVVRFELWGPEGLSSARLRETLPQRIDEGLRVRLAQTGVTGVSFLEADIMADAEKYPPKPRDWMPDELRDEYLYVPSAPSELTEVVSSVEKALDAVVRADLPKVAEDIRTAVANIDKQVIAAGLGELNREAKETLAGVRSAARQVVDDLRRAVDRFDSALEGVSASAKAVEERLRDPQIDAVLADARTAAAELKELMASGRVVVGDAQALLAGRSGEVAAILANLERLTGHLRSLAATAEHYPSWLLFGTQPEPGSRR